MSTSRADGHAHFWYHIPFCSIEYVLGMATKVSVYKHCPLAKVCSKDIGYPGV